MIEVSGNDRGLRSGCAGGQSSACAHTGHDVGRLPMAGQTSTAQAGGQTVYQSAPSSSAPQLLLKSSVSTEAVQHVTATNVTTASRTETAWQVPLMLHTAMVLLKHGAVLLDRGMTIAPPAGSVYEVMRSRMSAQTMPNLQLNSLDEAYLLDTSKHHKVGAYCCLCAHAVLWRERHCRQIAPVLALWFQPSCVF